MKNNFFYLILCLFLLITSVKGEVYTSLDGHKFEVNLKLQKNLIMLGEPSYMDFEVKNLSDKDLGVLWGGDYRNEFGRPDSFNVEAVDLEDKIVPKPKTFTMGGLIGFQKMIAGQKFNFRLYIPHWATIREIGKYRIQVEKDLVVKEYNRKNTNHIYSEKGVSVKLNTQIEVVPANFQKMGEIVNTIGKQLVEGDAIAEKLVPFIEDKGIVKYLVEVVEKNHWLMRNLAKFNDDHALSAIVNKINDSEDAVRRSISVSLSLSVHPKASLFLLQLRNDKFPAIRLDVVHFLGKNKTSESTELLKEMLNDEDKWVRDESKRYLLERGEKLN